MLDQQERSLFRKNKEWRIKFISQYIMVTINLVSNKIRYTDILQIYEYLEGKLYSSSPATPIYLFSRVAETPIIVCLQYQTADVYREYNNNPNYYEQWVGSLSLTPWDIVALWPAAFAPSLSVTPVDQPLSGRRVIANHDLSYQSSRLHWSFTENPPFCESRPFVICANHLRNYN